MPTRGPRAHAFTSGREHTKVVELDHWVLGRGGDVLLTAGIGSCVGVVLWDSWHDIAGMIHIQFPGVEPGVPHSKTPSASSRVGEGCPNRCADEGLTALFSAMAEWGAMATFTRAFLAGGSNMFPNIEMTDPAFDVGRRNIEAVERFLSARGIPIAARDTGGNWGRCMAFDVSSGSMDVTRVERR